MRKILACVLFLTCASLRGQSILTVAGGGPIGDGKPATEATFKQPNDVIVDAAGNLFIADNLNHRVRKVDGATGIITTIAGGGTSGSGDGGPATEAEVAFPSTIASDAGGNLYIGDSSPSPTIRRVDARTGIITTVARNLCTVNGMAFGPDGSLYLAEHCHRVRKVDVQTGMVTPVAGTGDFGFSGDGGPATEALLSTPADVAFNAAGDLFIADRGRIRKVNRADGIITTIAGIGPVSGPLLNNIPAISAEIQPAGLAFDSSGNLYLSRGRPHWVQRIDAQTGLISGVAGVNNTREPNHGDGGPALDADLNGPVGLAFDPAGNLLIADGGNRRIRRVDRNGIINTVAGGGPVGDGGPATSAQLSFPAGIALDGVGNLYIADRNHYRIRKLGLDSGTISTVAGTGIEGIGAQGDGDPATAASVAGTTGVAIDSKGNLFFSHRFGLVRRVDVATGVITTYAGRCCDANARLGDGGPATRANLGHFGGGLAFDANDNLYIANPDNHRIRRVDSRTRIITTVAGTGPDNCGTATASPECPRGGPMAEVGDGGPAAAAKLYAPPSVILDRAGNLYIADEQNHRVRKVDAVTGIITTVAGTGHLPGSEADGIPATQARVVPGWLAFDASENLYISETQNNRLRKIDANSGIITTVVGGRLSVAPGDGGPALQGSVIQPRGMVVDGRGDLYIADSVHNAVRVVYACVDVTPPALLEPTEGAADLTTAPILSWSSVFRAFRYDVYLDTVKPPSRLVASDLTASTFTPSNLLPGLRYYWRVVAKGDPFCTPVSTNSSAVRSFTTATVCEAPGAFALNGPSDHATNAPSAVQLSWQASPGADGYDVFLGPANPPQFFGSTPASTLSISSLVPGTRYYWNVVARAACDRTKTTSTPVRSFSVGGGCSTPGPFVQIAPATGATGVGTTAMLEWSPSANASSYDLFFGDTTPPPVYLPDLTTAKLTISGLAPGRIYYWRVTAEGDLRCESHPLDTHFQLHHQHRLHTAPTHHVSFHRSAKRRERTDLCAELE